MSHVFDDKKKILARIKRIKGQLDAVERSINEESECFKILQTLSACRGAMNGLMGELIEGHIKEHVVHHQNSKSKEDKAALELITLLKTYWK